MTTTSTRGSPQTIPSLLKIGNYSLISQEPTVISASDAHASLSRWLPNLLTFWQLLEEITGFRWKCTSYVRNSPTHLKGQAIDLAPEFAKSDEHYYATNNGSDPVLYKREWLIRRLQRMKNDPLPVPGMSIGVFIEPDHLHVQVLKPFADQSTIAVIKWKVPKPVYKDTFERMALPMFREV